jgi:hypothetical protein
MADEDAGLVLAFGSKHFQSKDSVGKNWKKRSQPSGCFRF